MTPPILFFDNVLARGQLFASSTAALFNVLNVIDWRTYTRWQPATMDAYIRVDCGTAQPADSLFIAGHNLHTMGTHFVRVRAGTTSSLGSSTLVAEFDVSDLSADAPFAIRFNNTSSRYWFVQFIGDGLNPDLTPHFGIIALGVAFVMPVGLVYGFDPFGRDIKGANNTAVEGDPLGSVINYEAFEESLGFNLTPISFMEDSFIPAWNRHLKLKPFGFWPNPAKVDAFVVRTKGGFKAPPRTATLCDLTFDVAGKFEQ
jgi:hypothetical protein